MEESLLNGLRSKNDQEFPVSDGLDSLLNSGVDDAEDILNGDDEQQTPEQGNIDNKEFLRNPEVQAEIIYTNYINSSGRIYSGKEKRRIRREILKKAKQGKYMKMFEDEINGIPSKQEKKAFEKLN